MMRRAASIGVLVLATLFAFASGSRAAMMPFAQADPAMWRWLPHGEDLFEPSRRHVAYDSAIGQREMIDERLQLGPPHATILYDADHGMVAYYQGCCAWQETVLASVTTRPPRALTPQNLAGLKSPRGIALGASPGAVLRAYGPATLHASTTTRGLRVLSYYRSQHAPGSPSCGWFENFVFRANRLIEIQAGHGC
jgi:hypothetical protein